MTERPSLCCHPDIADGLPWVALGCLRLWCRLLADPAGRRQTDLPK